MKFYAIALLALSSLSAHAAITCKAEKYTWVLENGKHVDGYSESIGWYEDPELRGTFYTTPWNGMQVGIQILDNPDAAYDISPYREQIGDIQIRHDSVAIPLKINADGSVSVTKKIQRSKVGEAKTEIVNVTLECKNFDLTQKK